MLIARLILKVTTASKGKLSVKDVLRDLENKYIPLMIIKTVSEKTKHEEVIDPE